MPADMVDSQMIQFPEGGCCNSWVPEFASVNLKKSLTADSQTTSPAVQTPVRIGGTKRFILKTAAPLPVGQFPVLQLAWFCRITPAWHVPGFVMRFQP